MAHEEYINNYYTSHLEGASRYPALSGNIDADVCVIGGGLAGINTALGLAERGKTAVVVEANRIGWGASGRNGGFVAKGYAAGDTELAEKLGLVRARELIELVVDARKLIRKRIADFSIPCGPIIDGVIFASMRDNPDTIRRHVDEANDDYGMDLVFWNRAQVREHCNTKRYYDGFFSPHDYQFNPLNYLHGIARAFCARGGRIFEDTEALKIERAGAGWAVHTDGGVVTVKDVVVCCSVYVDKLDPRLARASFPVRSYLISTEPIPEDVLKASVNTRHAVYELLFSSNYYRRLEGNRLLWGGRVGLWAQPHDIAKTIVHDILKLYPQMEGHIKPESAWSGLMCYAPHKMPQIGRIEPGYWYNTGYGGHGLCPTTAGGEIIAAAIAEGDQSYKKFEEFGLSYAGGKMGRYVAQLVYWWWRAQDFASLRMADMF